MSTPSHSSSPDAPAGKFDAFVSFASADRRKARRIQRFLESWKGPKGRLKVFLDETDLRGGLLHRELQCAVHESASLVVCHSPAARESKWVEAEVAAFRGGLLSHRIAVAMVGGTSKLSEVGRQWLPESDYRVHDLRSGWWLGLFGFGVKLELLKLLAFVSEVDMRTLRNWHLRRTIKTLLLTLLLSVIPVVGVLSIPVEHWQMVKLGESPTRRMFAIAAEVQDNKLLVAGRFRGQGPQGFRDYIETTRDAFASPKQRDFNPSGFRNRLLPNNSIVVSDSDRSAWAKLPPVDHKFVTSREFRPPSLHCSLGAGRYVAVFPLAPTEEEVELAQQAIQEGGGPDYVVPRVKGAVLATYSGQKWNLVLVEELTPIWDTQDDRAGPLSPSAGLPVAWSVEGDLWVGYQGKDYEATGGLWCLRSGGSQCERITGFLAVHSIALESINNRTSRIIIAERRLEYWSGGRLIPMPSRVIAMKANAAEWEVASAPPFGTRSEVELAGSINDQQLIRVDENVFHHHVVPLLRSLLR